MHMRMHVHVHICVQVRPLRRPRQGRSSALTVTTRCSARERRPAAGTTRTGVASSAIEHRSQQSHFRPHGYARRRDAREMTSLSTGHSVETRLVLERLRRIVGGGGTRADALPRGTDARGTARATAGPLSSRRKAQRGAWLPSRRGAVCPDRTPPHRISLEPPLAILSVRCGLVAWFAFGGVVSAGRLLRMINWLVGEMQSFVDVCVCVLSYSIINGAPRSAPG